MELRFEVHEKEVAFLEKRRKKTIVIKRQIMQRKKNKRDLKNVT